MRPASGPGLSRSTTAAYDADWQLFLDWSDTTDHAALPADAGIVLAFLRDCPAALGTLRRRVAAIDRHHQQAGAPPPGRDPAVSAALQRTPPSRRRLDDNTVQASLLALPSHGWTQGLFGRRDRLLLVLRAAEATPAQLAAATAGDLTVGETGATLVTTAPTAARLELPPSAEPQTCRACVAARWLRLINLLGRTVSHRPLQHALQVATPITAGSPHACRRPPSTDAAVGGLPLLPRFDQWGYTTLPPTAVQPRSLHRLATAHLAAKPPRRRALASPAGAGEPAVTALAPPVVAPALGPPDLAAGIAALHWQKQRSADIDRLLDELDARASAALARSRAYPY